MTIFTELFPENVHILSADHVQLVLIKLYVIRTICDFNIEKYLYRELKRRK